MGSSVESGAWRKLRSAAQGVVGCDDGLVRGRTSVLSKSREGVHT